MLIRKIKPEDNLESASILKTATHIYEKNRFTHRNAVLLGNTRRNAFSVL